MIARESSELTFAAALALLRSSVSPRVSPLTDAQVEQLLARDAADEALNLEAS